MDPETTHATYTWLGNDLPYVSFLLYFAFSLTFAIMYCVLAEYWPGIKMWQGAVFGIAIYVAFHIVLMPLLGVVPAPWDQPWQEHCSEFLGHIVWMWSIEVVRRDTRNRITGEPDAEFQTNAATAR